MRHLDRLLANAENPPFDRAARLWLDLGGVLGKTPVLLLSVTTVSGNGKHESPKKRLERAPIYRAEDLEARVLWALRVTDERRLSPPKIDETYEARPLGYDGPLRVFGAELDCRLESSKALVAPQVLVEIAASLIPAEPGTRAACFARARFQGMLVTPHIIDVKIFDTDLPREDDERWPILKMWAQQSAGNNKCSIGV